ncbi:multidrug effflux MFS transporter [Rahnella aceris]|uniref:multidrug effflux MFS transporter n=1 Tax=Rahnella sp. (strain Y9602) TaxID=2703885 RepID=UPI000EAD594A|nr:multidrug effflux MFS transporter [Rahnella aceris]MBU9864528.1 multidrug effflux MFS transporter [Rahnella aceris]RKT81168.1 DHA1 family bicyclomycin/chloramphenicol resistance-like MFS transporter [Rahnella aquatilis]
MIMHLSRMKQTLSYALLLLITLFNTGNFMPRLSFIITVAMLSAFGLIASDIYLPAMPDMAREFAVDPSRISQTISAYLLALAICQLFYGPLADRFGRKPVLLAGIAIYIGGSLGCAIAESYSSFLLFRLLQGAGAAAGLVIGRTLIADTCNKAISARVYSVIYPLVSLSPAIAPMIGGHLAATFGWHTDFIFVAIFGMATMLMIIFMRETRPENISATTSPFSGFSVICSDTGFWRYTLIVCCIYSAWFIYLTQSPFLFAQLGMSEEARGWLYIPLTAGIISANVLTKRLLNFWQYDRIVTAGIMCFVLGGLAYATVMFTAEKGILSILLPMCLVSLANGSSLSLAISGAISSGHGHAATASGMIGFMQIGSAAVFANFISAEFGFSQPVLGSSVLLLALTALVACRKQRIRRHHIQSSR